MNETRYEMKHMISSLFHGAIKNGIVRAVLSTRLVTGFALVLPLQIGFHAGSDFTILTAAQAAAVPTPSGTTLHRLDVNGSARSFWIHVPETLPLEGRIPLVIALHGGGSNGAAMERFSGLSETADECGFIVAYPNGTGRTKRLLTWNAGTCCGWAQKHRVDDVAFIRMLAETAIKDFRADPSRVYATGMSNGAMMVYRLAAEIPECLAAVAPVSGTLLADADRITQCMPLLHFHGSDDQYVPFEGGRGSHSLVDIQHASVQQTLDVWVRANGANPDPVVEPILDRFEDGTRVVRYAYRAGSDSQSVVLYKIIGGGHTWPGNPGAPRALGRTTTEISANALMWKFFRAHTKGP